MAARSTSNAMASTPIGAPTARIRSTTPSDGSIGGPSAKPVSSASDVIAARTVPAVQEHPIAAAALKVLLAATESMDVESALVLESATYSTLQAGPEHQA